jgi:hypothetical protein
VSRRRSHANAADLLVRLFGSVGLARGNKLSSELLRLLILVKATRGVMPPMITAIRAPIIYSTSSTIVAARRCRV